jgi:hypothetical protein
MSAIANGQDACSTQSSRKQKQKQKQKKAPPKTGERFFIINLED